MEQINLNRPELWPRPIPFSASAMALSLGARLAGLGALSAFQSLRLDDRRQALAAAEAQRDRLRAELREAQQASQSRQQGLERLRRQVAALQERQAAFRKAERELGQRLRATGRKGALVRGLGRARAEQGGVWLTGFGLEGVAPVTLRLEGRALQPEAIPRYLRAVAGQEGYRGGFFSDLTANTPQPDGSRRDGILTFQSQATFPVVGHEERPETAGPPRSAAEDSP